MFELQNDSKTEIIKHGWRYSHIREYEKKLRMYFINIEESAVYFTLPAHNIVRAVCNSCHGAVIAAWNHEDKAFILKPTDDAQENAREFYLEYPFNGTKIGKWYGEDAKDIEEFLKETIPIAEGCIGFSVPGKWNDEYGIMIFDTKERKAIKEGESWY